jgi:hypothetical protein
LFGEVLRVAPAADTMYGHDEYLTIGIGRRELWICRRYCRTSKPKKIGSFVRSKRWKEWALLHEALRKQRAGLRAAHAVEE